MSKLKISRPTIYILLAAVAVSAWVLTSEESARKGRQARRSTASASVKLPDGFTDQDLKAKFDPVNESVRDSFVPLVVRTGGSATSSSPDAVPSALTGGDPNWVFTGMAEIDGVPMALIENKATGEGAFLKHAEAWKMAKIASISPTQLVLTGQDGREYKLTISTTEIRSTLMAQGFAPVNPPLQGSIGGDIQVSPERNRPNGRSNTVAQAPNPTNETRDGQN